MKLKNVNTGKVKMAEEWGAIKEIWDMLGHVIICVYLGASVIFLEVTLVLFCVIGSGPVS